MGHVCFQEVQEVEEGLAAKKALVLEIACARLVRSGRCARLSAEDLVDALGAGASAKVLADYPELASAQGPDHADALQAWVFDAVERGAKESPQDIGDLYVTHPRNSVAHIPRGDGGGSLRLGAPGCF